MEAISKAISRRTLGELENYFSNYSDLPREIVLKHDLLRVGHWFSDAALELASQALVKSYRLFSYDLMPMKDMKRKEHRKIPEWFTIRRGMYCLRPVSIQTSLDSSSPYVIDVVDGQAKLFLGKKEICEVYFGNPVGILSPVDGQLLQQLEEVQPADAATRVCPPRKANRLRPWHLR